MSTPYAQFHGKDITDELICDSITSSGGGRKVDEYTYPGWPRAELCDNGREAARFSGELDSSSISDLRQIVSEFNHAPEDVIFHPFDADYCTYVQFASARTTEPYRWQDPVAGQSTRFGANFDLYCREAALFGEQQGLTHDMFVDLPAESGTITASTEDNTIDHVALSGDYVDGKYTKLVDMTVNGHTTRLINQMMRRDLFAISRWGEVRHSYEIDFRDVWSFTDLYYDLHGSTFVSGATISNDTVSVLSGRIMVPFFGPLPASGTPAPKLDFYLISGSPTVWHSFASDLSDIAEVECTVKPGYNSIEIPDCDGHSFVSFGLKGTFVISSFYAEIHRYISEYELPVIKDGDKFTIKISDGDYSNHTLRHLIAVYRDKHWW